MGERTHTPGPWRVAGKGTIRTETAWVASINWRNREANAALIAAAPTMFDGIEEARSQAEMLLLAIVEGDPASELKLRVNDLLDVLAKATPHV